MNDLPRLIFAAPMSGSGKTTITSGLIAALTAKGDLPGRAVMTTRLTLGYREMHTMADNWLWRAGECIRGHEFHYST